MAVTAHYARFLKPPYELLLRTRWFFLVLSFANAAVALPLVLTFSDAPIWTRLLAGLALLWLGGRWIAEYTSDGTGRRPYVWHGGDLAALAAIAAAAGPSRCLGVFYVSLFFWASCLPRMRLAVTVIVYCSAYAWVAIAAPPATGLGSMFLLNQLLGFPLSAAMMHSLIVMIGHFRRTEDRYRDLFEHANDIIYMHDLDGRFTSVNQRALELSGFTRDEIVGQSITTVIAPEYQLVVEDMMQRKLLDHRSTRYELEMVTKAGQRIALDLVTRLMVREGKPVGVQGIARDITEQKRAAEALQASEERYRKLAEFCPTPILVHSGGFLRYVNGACVRLLGGREPADLLGKPLLDLVPPVDRERVRDEIARMEVIEGSEFGAVEERLLRLDGAVIDTEVSAMSIVYEGKLAILAAIQNITERKRAEAALEHMALHDPLTGLPNRSFLRDRLKDAIAAARAGRKPLALLFMDLDRFKEVNDSLGHHYGDSLLQQIADRLQHAVRPGDVVTRLGGDEFAVLLPDRDEVEAAVLGQQIISLLDDPFEVEEHTFDVGVSIGIAVYPTHGEDAANLMRHADVAMYTAKRTGTGYVVYTSEQDRNSPARLVLMRELRAAIEHGDLILHYQPQVNLRTGCAEHVEALVRWQHPERGVVPPASFIPLAQETGLIKPLTLWVLHAALRQCAEWHAQGIDMRVAINLSAQTLHDPHLVDTIDRALDAWRVKPSALLVEITESDIIVDPDRALDTLERLHSMGVQIAIDDFGTGYSSLAYLKRLPVDEIKIDRSFVMEMAEHSDNRFIVRSVIDLARNLGIGVVAEGVENQQALDALTLMGCDMIQGYYLSPPIPADAIPAWLGRKQWAPASA